MKHSIIFKVLLVASFFSNNYCSGLNNDYAKSHLKISDIIENIKSFEYESSKRYFVGNYSYKNIEQISIEFEQTKFRSEKYLLYIDIYKLFDTSIIYNIKYKLYYKNSPIYDLLLASENYDSSKKEIMIDNRIFVKYNQDIFNKLDSLYYNWYNIVENKGLEYVLENNIRPLSNEFRIVKYQ